MSRSRRNVRQSGSRRESSRESAQSTDKAATNARDHEERTSPDQAIAMAGSTEIATSISTDDLNVAGFVEFMNDVWDEQDPETIDDYSIDELFDEFPETQERPTALILGEFNFDNTLVEDEDMEEFDD